MALNQVILNGKLPHFNGTFKEAVGEKKAFLSWAVSVKRDFKPADAQYYPEDLINIKAFGPKAEFINKFFKQGDGLILTGRLQRDDDYEKDGQTIKGQLCLSVETVSFADGTNKGGESDKASVAKPTTPGRPGAPVTRPGATRPPVGGARTPGTKPF